MTVGVEPRFRIHAFASVKGGVGKSSLAIACGKLLAASGRRPMVVDCDLTGTSFADGMKLLAPKAPLASNGTLEWDRPSTGQFHSVEETAKLRRQRRDTPLLRGSMIAHVPPPYLNDLLRQIDMIIEEQRPTDFLHFDGALWRHLEPDGVEYLPSSPFIPHIHEGSGWMMVKDDEVKHYLWVKRLAWVIHFVLLARPDLTDIVIDLPPNIAGLAHEVLALLYHIERGKTLVEGFPPWQRGDMTFGSNAFLVLSPDRNDWLPGLEYWLRNQHRVPSLRPLVNRVNEPREDIVERMRQTWSIEASTLDFEQVLHFVDELPLILGQIFRRGNLVVDAKVRALMDVLRLEGGAP